jgi:hypothetical protein
MGMLDQKTVSTAEVVGGMAMLLFGHKLKGLSLFSHGMYGLEQEYRKNHPDLEPGFEARWQRAVEFYDAVIVTGAVGLLAARPYTLPWLTSAASFAVGWAMNIAGHSMYEKNSPAFTEDPLAFVAGPVWDLKQMLNQPTVPPRMQAPEHLEATVM